MNILKYSIFQVLICLTRYVFDVTAPLCPKSGIATIESVKYECEKLDHLLKWWRNQNLYPGHICNLLKSIDKTIDVIKCNFTKEIRKENVRNPCIINCLSTLKSILHETIKEFENLNTLLNKKICLMDEIKEFYKILNKFNQSVSETRSCLECNGLKVRIDTPLMNMLKEIIMTSGNELNAIKWSEESLKNNEDLSVDKYENCHLLKNLVGAKIFYFEVIKEIFIVHKMLWPFTILNDIQDLQIKIEE